MFLQRCYVPYEDVVPASADNVDLADLVPGHGEFVVQLLDGERDVDIILKPVKRAFHG